MHKGKEHMLKLPVELPGSNTDDHTESISPMYYLHHAKPDAEALDNREYLSTHNSLSDETT